MSDPIASPSPSSGESSAPAVSSSQPDTAPSAPASSWDDAFSGAGLTGSPTADDAPVDPTTPAPAIAAPDPAGDAPSEAEVVAPSDKGPIPFERHKSIVENTRTKTLNEVASRVEQHFGPAIALQRQLQTDPVGTFTQLVDEALEHPQIGAAVLSHMARALSARRGQKTAAVGAEEPGPDLTGQDDQGREVRFYSAEQQAKRDAWARAQILSEVDARTAPLQQDLKSRADREAAERRNTEIRTTVTARLEKWRERPGFAEHEADIAAAQADYVRQGIDTWNALGLAYADVVQAKVLPKAQATSQQDLVRQAVKKAAASTASPSMAAPSAKARASSWDEAFDQVGLHS